MNTRIYLVLFSHIVLCVHYAHSQLVTEYFNDYGAAQTDLRNLGSATNGWSGAWTGGTNIDYIPSNLAYSAPGYSNAANESDGDNGRAIWETGNTLNGVSRSFAAGLSGTIWLTALAQNGTAGGESILWLDGAANSANALRLFGEYAQIRYNDSTDAAVKQIFSAGVTHLYLAKLQVDYSGSFDSVEMWVDPNLTSGALSIGAPLYSESGADVFGTQFDKISISFDNSGDSWDAIRISNTPTAFFDVTSSVPEASTASLILIGGCLMLLGGKSFVLRPST